MKKKREIRDIGFASVGNRKTDMFLFEHIGFLVMLQNRKSEDMIFGYVAKMRKFCFGVVIVKSVKSYVFY